MRIVVKVGSNVVARPDGRLWIARMAGLADEVAALCDAGHQVLIVSSGAVAAGRGRVSLPKTVDRVARRQVLSAVGQAILIDTYRTLFDADGMDVGQILVTKYDLSSAEHAANLRQCVEAFFAYGIVPVVNENDTVSVEGLMFTDNDELAGLMAKLLGAQLLIVLSSVDGLCDGDPADGWHPGGHRQRCASRRLGRGRRGRGCPLHAVFAGEVSGEKGTADCADFVQI